MTTSTPTTASEWQLHKVLTRANLLQYYDVFISQGGDDVQQLCEAGEEEFLEIMALVGMASKPLHVRRLQKALQEWVANPALYTPPTSLMCLTPQTSSSSYMSISRSSTPVTTSWSSMVQDSTTSVADNGSPNTSAQDEILNNLKEIEDKFRPLPSTSPVPSHQSVLTEAQINAIAESAGKLAKELPLIEPKYLNQKKPINREISSVMSLEKDDPNRMEEIRKFAAIYGRFDSKRRNDKPMSLHEVSVNEAAAQISNHLPALLTRREDLFPLARQVVRDSGYQYSKGQSRAGDTPVAKKSKLDPSFQKNQDHKSAKMELAKLHREERMSAINEELNHVIQKQDELKTQLQEAKDNKQTEAAQKLQSQLEILVARQLQLLQEQSVIIQKQKRSERYRVSKTNNSNVNGNGDAEEDVTDSSNVPSGSSSPQYSHDGEDYDSMQAKPNDTSLFEEGLRFAQQYGMSDFATQLKELSQKFVDEDGDENSREEEGIPEDPAENNSEPQTEEAADSK